MIARRKILLGLVGVAAGAGVYALVDLRGRRSSNLRQFDPDDVARLETAMLRSYYDKHPVRLFRELALLLRRQYHLPFLRSYVVGFHGARAAFVFKEGTRRSEFERALPDLVRYYNAVRDISDTPFDSAEAARLELEWWIIHRQRENYPPADLDRALAELPAAIYHVPSDRLLEHGHYRAVAMVMRDDLSIGKGVGEEDWKQITNLLVQSWRSLWHAVNGAM
jgi:hypothetical protein